jgi:hypothetical protein
MSEILGVKLADKQEEDAGEENDKGLFVETLMPSDSLSF